MRSLNLSGQDVSTVICELLKSALLFGLDRVVADFGFGLDWCSSRRFTRFLRIWPMQKVWIYQGKM